MRQQDIEIQNAQHRISSLEELHSVFLQHLAKHAVPEALPAEINVSDRAITINAFGKAITAEPKVIVNEHSEFAIEYVFYAKEDDLKQELWRFYLTADGRLANDSNHTNYVCDYDNKYVAKHICRPVMFAALSSILFKPTVTNAG